MLLNAAVGQRSAFQEFLKKDEQKLEEGSQVKVLPNFAPSTGDKRVAESQSQNTPKAKVSRKPSGARGDLNSVPSVPKRKHDSLRSEQVPANDISNKSSSGAAPPARCPPTPASFDASPRSDPPLKRRPTDEQAQPSALTDSPSHTKARSNPPSPKHSADRAESEPSLPPLSLSTDGRSPISFQQPSPRSGSTPAMNVAHRGGLNRRLAPHLVKPRGRGGARRGPPTCRFSLGSANSRADVSRSAPPPKGSTRSSRSVSSRRTRASKTRAPPKTTSTRSVSSSSSRRRSSIGA